MEARGPPLMRKTLDRAPREGGTVQVRPARIWLAAITAALLVAIALVVAVSMLDQRPTGRVRSTLPAPYMKRWGIRQP